MNLVILVLLAVIAYLLSRIQFLLKANSDDLADLRHKMVQLQQALQTQTTKQDSGRPKNQQAVSATQLQKAVERIDINTISKNGLQKIPGIGATCAQRVIEGRPYQSLEQLDHIAGITQTQRKNLKQHLTV